ncbi:adenylate cyclase [Duganella sp. CF402]|uniref:CHASE2 domain-containing protein n=1 Tax=unclassified Duganella TaxID=2636909 RepID=UPI0008C09DD5|nr:MULTISPECIES: adenylate/guanylate cyclase domain-containing protein [unclassified Duganella]RZT09226.1 adenylate cyclase [Duganella sp. BK701]SEL65669.1 adenylate cyclase [Duganella sp. CF402]
MRLLPAKLGKTLAKYGWRWLLGILITLAGVFYSLDWYSNDTVARLDNLWAGERMKLEPPVLDKRIVIVDIDGKSLTEFGRFPWSRNVQGALISQLVDHYQVKAVGYDISFPEPDTSSGYNVLEKLSRTELKDVPVLRQRLEELKPMMDYDGVFATALKGKPVILGFNLSPDQIKGALPKPLFSESDLNGRELLAYNAPGYEANVPVLTQAAAGAGSFSVVTDPDGIVRSAYLIQQVEDHYYPSLSLATASLYLDALAVKPLLSETADQLSQAQLDSGGYDALTMLLPGRKQRLIPVGEAMSTVVQYRGRGGPHGGSFRYVSAADVLTGRAPADILKGTAVLIGTTAPGLVDLRATPVNPEYPGVEIHANLIRSMLDNRFKQKPYYAFILEAASVLVVGLALSFGLAALSPLRAILSGVAVLAAAVGMNYYLYREMDLIFNLAMLVIVIVSVFVINVAWGYFFEVRKGVALVSRFGEYVAPELVAEMAEDPEKYNMDGESRELTVMFVDVRGFTTISEGLTPKALREYINLYLTAMSEDIRSAHQGTLDKYIGDAVMAFWGAPVAFDDHASRGVATSLLMQASAKRLNQDFLARGWPELKIGIGLNTGMMHVGDMGSNIRRAYTVMGDAVNLGSRLEGITKVYGVGIAVGESTRAAAPEFTYRELDLVRVKGKNEPVAIFEPIALAQDTDEATKAEVARWHEALAAVRAQRWDEASSILAELQALSPQRGLYQLYVERIAYYRAHPPGEGWDGVTTFETK